MFFRGQIKGTPWKFLCHFLTLVVLVWTDVLEFHKIFLLHLFLYGSLLPPGYWIQTRFKQQQCGVLDIQKHIVVFSSWSFSIVTLASCLILSRSKSLRKNASRLSLSTVASPSILLFISAMAQGSSFNQQGVSQCWHTISSSSSSTSILDSGLLILFLLLLPNDWCDNLAEMQGSARPEEVSYTGERTHQTWAVVALQNPFIQALKEGMEIEKFLTLSSHLKLCSTFVAHFCSWMSFGPNCSF